MGGAVGEADIQERREFGDRPHRTRRLRLGIAPTGVRTVAPRTTDRTFWIHTGLCVDS